MTKELSWRLKMLPTVDEVAALVEKGIISKDEAKKLLFTEKDEKDRDVKSLEEEIIFLRKLVEKLSNSQTTTIIEKIREVEVPYIKRGWYRPYDVWCKADNTLNTTGYTLTANSGSGTLMAMTDGASGSTTLAYNTANDAGEFSKIRTF